MSRIGALAWILMLAGTAFGQEPPKALPDLLPGDKSLRPRDIPKTPEHLRPLHASSLRGMDWLQRANQPDGKFLPGFLPALAIKAEGDPFGPQTEAALALLRAARYHNDDRALTLGKQSLLRLLQDTTTDTAQPAIRFTSAPEPFVNRLAACGGLLQAIYELPHPPDDLRIQAGQLANYLRAQIQADGSFLLGVDDPALKVHLLQTCTGPALAGLAAFERHESPAKKNERTVAALYAHHAMWRQSKNPAMVPGISAACRANITAASRPDQAEVQILFEMNDWLINMQYPADPRQPLAGGGFMPWQNGKTANLPPDATTAFYVGSLIDACRVARQMGDQQRDLRYRQGIEQALAFLITLQYTDARVQHYAEWFRPWILGGFFNNHQDGNLRLSSTANATAALVAYLEHLAKSEP
ncbi:MAG: hypothetical protein WCL32_24110 [Planctomycetota bacterium]